MRPGSPTYFKDLAADSGSDQNFYSVLTQYYGGTVEGGTPSTDVKYESRFGKALTDKDAYPATAPGECELAAPCVGGLRSKRSCRASSERTGFRQSFRRAPARARNLTSSTTCCSRPTSTPASTSARAGSIARLKVLCVPRVCQQRDETEGFEVFAVQPYVNGVKGCDSGQHPNGISDGALDGGLVHEYAEMLTDPYLANWTN